MLMANAVMEEAAVTAGKEARAMESFANALRNMPAIIAENGGYDSAQLVSELRALHKQGNKTAGLGNYPNYFLNPHFFQTILLTCLYDSLRTNHFNVFIFRHVQRMRWRHG